MLNGKKKKIAFYSKITSGLILLSSGITLSSILTSCNEPKEEVLNIGSWDGTDWEGYESGKLYCGSSDHGLYAEIYVEADYKAHNLVIPDAIKYPGGKILPLKGIQYIFNTEKNLTGTLTLGKNITNIHGSFNGLKNVKNDLVFTNNIVVVEESFNNCGFDGKLFIGDSLEYIDEYSFRNNNFTSLGVSEYNFIYGLATNVGSECQALVYKDIDGKSLFDWQENNLILNLAYGKLTIPTDIESIGKNVLTNCKNLKGNLTIPSNIKSIGENSFANCGFDGVLTIGKKLESLGDSAFSGNNFSSISVSSENDFFGLAINAGEECYALVHKEGDDFLVDFSNEDSVVSDLVFGTLEIPSEIEDLDPYLIRKCVHLDSIKLEVENESDYVLVQSGAVGNFTGEISLSHPGFMLNKTDISSTPNADMQIKSLVPAIFGELIIPDSLENHKIIAIGNDFDEQDDDVAFCGLEIPKITTGENLKIIYGSSFRNCKITEVNLTNVAQIGHSAFEGEGIVKVSLPKITATHTEAFEFQYEITSITVDASVNPTAFDFQNAFSYCTGNDGKLTNISTINGNFKEQWKEKLSLENWEWTN